MIFLLRSHGNSLFLSKHLGIKHLIQLWIRFYINLKKVNLCTCVSTCLEIIEIIEIKFRRKAEKDSEMRSYIDWKRKEINLMMKHSTSMLLFVLSSSKLLLAVTDKSRLTWLKCFTIFKQYLRHTKTCANGQMVAFQKPDFSKIKTFHPKGSWSNCYEAIFSICGW